MYLGSLDPVFSARSCTQTKSRSETCFHKCSVALFFKGVASHYFSNMNGQLPINSTDDVLPWRSTPVVMVIQVLTREATDCVLVSAYRAIFMIPLSEFTRSLRLTWITRMLEFIVFLSSIKMELSQDSPLFPRKKLNVRESCSKMTYL